MFVIYNILHFYIINVYYNNTLYFIILVIVTFCSSDGFIFKSI